MGKFIQFVLLVGGMLIAMSGKTLAAEGMAAGEGTDKKVSVSVQVVDKEGNALATGKVTVKHSDAQAETNERGKFSLRVGESDTLVVFYPGKRKREISVRDFADKRIVMEDFIVRDEEGVYYLADSMPRFPEGEPTMWVARNIRFPFEAQARGASGKINVTFVVDEQGNVTDVNTLAPRNANFTSDVDLLWEAIRVVSSMPRWIPGKVDGKPACVRCYVPVTFRNTGMAPPKSR